jgi:hypothetical protein
MIRLMGKAKPFSTKLESWLNGDKPKTFASLNRVFAEKSLAILILAVMFIPALPVPSGGVVSHALEAVGAFLAIQLALGRRSLWLPKRWRKTSFGRLGKRHAVPFLIRRIQWLERFSRPRGTTLLHARLFVTLMGIFLTTFCVVAFLAPPFSGLDTFPAIGVVILALGIILDDIIIVCCGVVAGVLGSALVVGAGATIIYILNRIWAVI